MHTYRLWELTKMVGYNGNFPTPLAEHHKCPCCSYALRDPLQTECGHRICKECYADLQRKRYIIDIKTKCGNSPLWFHFFSSVSFIFVIFLVERLVRLFAQLMDLLCYHTKSSLVCTLKERSLTFQLITCIEIAAANCKVPWENMR